MTYTLVVVFPEVQGAANTPKLVLEPHGSTLVIGAESTPTTTSNRPDLTGHIERRVSIPLVDARLLDFTCKAHASSSCRWSCCSRLGVGGSSVAGRSVSLAEGAVAWSWTGATEWLPRPKCATIRKSLLPLVNYVGYLKHGLR